MKRKYIKSDDKNIESLSMKRKYTKSEDKKSEESIEKENIERWLKESLLDDDEPSELI
tara:strand:+ start:2750 stop:2923 length:174 start_codon:yes stop_codon:yes gene_type:complete